MTSSAIDVGVPDAVDVTTSEDTLTVELGDGRSLSVPLTRYPRLLHATLAERANWRLIGRGQGMHWPDIEEDVSVESLLAGRRSGEGSASLARWLQQRQA